MSFKSEVTTRSQLNLDRKRKYKKEESSDSSDNDSDWNEEDSEEEEEMNMQEYRKFLSKIFPSKFLSDKIKQGETEIKSKKKHNKKSPIKKKAKRNNIVYSDESNSDESEYEASEDIDDSETLGSEDTSEEEEEEEEDEKPNGKSETINIVLTLDGIGKKKKNVLEEEESDDEDPESDENESDENESDEDESDDEEESDDEQTNSDKEQMIKSENKEVNGLINMLKNYDPENNSNVIDNCIKACEKEIKRVKKEKEKKIIKHKDKNKKEFRKLLSASSNTSDTTKFQKLEITEQNRLLEKIRIVNTYSETDKSQLLDLIDADIPVHYKATALRKFNCLKYMDPSNSEYFKLKTWVETFMSIPFNKFSTFPISIEDGIDKCHDFMMKAKETIDNAVFGLNDAKMQIMQLMGQMITNPKSVGTAIAIKGPMGTGKTTLVKEGISKILNRPFAFIALGGATDSSSLEGHSYTYEGSVWGKIVQILIESRCMNPVIYFDELDKISDTPKGEEIVGILTHLTDTSQNSQFHDKYFSEIDFDLSKCLFIFSYNDESKVNPILKDRMYRIETKGYDLKSKTIISEKHLIPSIMNLVSLKEGEITFPKEAIHHIINNVAEKEDGVRNLKRAIEIIFTKLNLCRLVKPNTKIFEDQITLDMVFPLTITKELIDKLIKIDKQVNMSLQSLYI